MRHHNLAPRGSVATLVILLSALASGGCFDFGQCTEIVPMTIAGTPTMVQISIPCPVDVAAKPARQDTRARLKTDRQDGGARIKYLEISAKPRRQDASEMFQPPYLLQGKFQVELTQGIYIERGAQNIGDGFFGLRIAPDDATNDEFYACYAQYLPDLPGLHVYVFSHDGQVGDGIKISGRTTVDMFAVSDGSEITFRAGPAGFPPIAPTEIATVAIASPDEPYRASFEVVGIASRARVGTEKFIVPENDGPPVMKSKAGEVQQTFYRGSAELMTGAAALNKPTPSLGMAQFKNDLALIEYGKALDDAQTLPNGRAKNATIAKLKKLIREVHKANAIIARRQNQASLAARAVLARFSRGAFRSALTIHKKIDPLAEAAKR